MAKRGRKRHDVVGQRFGRLVAVSAAPDISATKWFCRCDCGKFYTARLHNLRSGATRSCGCLYEQTRGGNETHGKTGTREHGIWKKMRDRCDNPKSDHWERYGGRGIRVCERWMKFENFIADMGNCPTGLSIGRKDNNGHYEPGNCRWETATEQANNKCNTVFLELGEHRMTMAEWARRLNMSRQALHHRIESGWAVEDALTRPKGSARPGYVIAASKAKRPGAYSLNMKYPDWVDGGVKLTRRKIAP